MKANSLRTTQPFAWTTPAFLIATLALAILLPAGCNSRSRQPANATERELTATVATTTEPANVEINFSQVGGPFLQLNTLWPPHRDETNPVWWNKFDVTIINNCTGPVSIDPKSFILFISGLPKTESASAYGPFEAPANALPYILKSTTVQPGQSVHGELVFEIPERIPSGTESNGAYKMLRLQSGTGREGCEIKYTPDY